MVSSPSKISITRRDQPVSIGTNDVLNGLRGLDDETLLAVGFTTMRNRRLATEKGNAPLAALHGMVSVLVDRALLERANARGPEVREYIMRDDGVTA